MECTIHENVGERPPKEVEPKSALEFSLDDIKGVSLEAIKAFNILMEDNK